MNLGKIEKWTLSPAGKRYRAVSVVSFFFHGNTAQISYFYTQNQSQLMNTKEAVSKLMHWMSERQPLLLVIGEKLLLCEQLPLTLPKLYVDHLRIPLRQSALVRVAG